ncbi:hypothetical protein AAMO2058_001284400 [Amorphochlora amoebiformis]
MKPLIFNDIERFQRAEMAPRRFGWRRRAGIIGIAVILYIMGSDGPLSGHSRPRLTMQHVPPPSDDSEDKRNIEKYYEDREAALDLARMDKHTTPNQHLRGVSNQDVAEAYQTMDKIDDWNFGQQLMNGSFGSRAKESEIDEIEEESFMGPQLVALRKEASTKTEKSLFEARYKREREVAAGIKAEDDESTEFPELKDYYLDSEPEIPEDSALFGDPFEGFTKEEIQAKVPYEISQERLDKYIPWMSAERFNETLGKPLLRYFDSMMEYNRKNGYDKMGPPRPLYVRDPETWIGVTDTSSLSSEAEEAEASR